MTPTFHLGLCMAGSVSAGAYTAGVVDYLLETLRNWEQAKASGEAGLPIHQVEIDLLGGTSGGGITAALAFFGFRDAYTPSVLHADRRTYEVDPNNIFWNTWVKLSGDDMVVRLLDPSDIKPGFVKSALNSGFIDELANEVGRYIERLSTRRMSEQVPAFLSSNMELYMTLFNVTGIKYLLLSKGFGSVKQYIAEHRDLAHFRYANAYRNDGRIEVSMSNLQNLNILLDAAKATGAFPGGLEARKVCRLAKHIWDNPFFQKNNKFNQSNIILGENIKPEDLYCSLNADGGTSNNEPVELMRNLMVAIRNEEQPDGRLADFDAMNETEKKVVKSELDNYTIVLIDPFPSYDFDIKVPKETDKGLKNYALKLVAAMADQLRFDAKEAKDAYDKDNYGLYVVAPSRDGVEPEHALASGALGGFSGFLHPEYRIHDFFLGRHNCQSFLRKHFAVSLDEDQQSNASFNCIQAVLEGYKANPEAIKRFAFEDIDGKMKVPILPDVALTEPISYSRDNDGTVQWHAQHNLPTYQMHLPHRDFLQQYHGHITRRTNRLLNNAIELNTIQDLVRRGVVKMYDDNLADKVIKIITQTLNERKLLR